jgi:hypothetical protein
MRLLIVYYSLSGNNRVLAEHLGQRLGAKVVAVREKKKKRTGFMTFLDLMLKRKQEIQPLDVSPTDYDHVLLIAPLWDMSIAYPMATAIRQQRDSLVKFSFVSLCGYVRPGQSDHVVKELETLTGNAPQRVWELHVGDLVPPKDRRKVWIVSRYKVKPAELASFEKQINQIVEYFSH